MNPMLDGRRIEVIGVTVVACGLAAALLLFAWTGYPVIMEASYHFGPPAISRAAGQGFVNPLTELATLDSTGQARFLWYPPLMPLILSLLLPAPTAEGALRAMAALNAVHLVLCAVLFMKAAEKVRDRFVKWGSVSLGLVATASFFSFYMWGRPEWLATLWVTLGSAVFFWVPVRWTPVAFGILLGLMGATHPVGAVMSILWIGIAFCLRESDLKWILKRWVVSGTVAAGVFFLIMQASPYGFRESMQGIRTHAAIAVPLAFAQPSLSAFIRVFMTRAQYPLLGLLIGIMPILGYTLWNAAGRDKSTAVRAFFLFLYGTLSFLVCFFVFIGTFREYNALFMLPLFMILALRGIGHAHVPRVLQGLALVAGLGLSIGFIRTAVLYPFYLKAGLRLNDARRIFDEFKRSQPSGVVYQASYSLWVLSEDYARMRVVIPTQSHLNPKEPYVLQQSYMGPAFQRPPVLPGFQLQKSFFVSGVPRLWGLKIASTMPGYGFSVYRPDSGAPLNKG